MGEVALYEYLHCILCKHLQLSQSLRVNNLFKEAHKSQWEIIKINQNLRSSAKQVSPKKTARPSLNSNFTLVAYVFYRE